jgi:pyruvate formate lyase activating enzyme
MNSTRATVSSILTYSIVDGPGNRFVIFLQGCNFDCACCHNPDTIEQDNPMARQYSVAEILELLREHLPFLTGVTVSGGEPTKQLKFVIALFRAIKADKELAGLSCFIDSNGYLGEAGWKSVLPVTDGVMLDIKSFDNAMHKELTTKGNSKSLQSARILHAAGKLYELRFLLIPGKTDSNAELDGLIEFVRTLGSDTRIKLNAFQHHGVRAKTLEWEKMSEAGVDKAAERLRAAGIDNVVTPALYL